MRGWEIGPFDKIFLQEELILTNTGRHRKSCITPITIVTMGDTILILFTFDHGDRFLGVPSPLTTKSMDSIWRNYQRRIVLHQFANLFDV